MKRAEIEGILGEYLYEKLCQDLPFGYGLAYGGTDDDEDLVVRDQDGHEWMVEVDVSAYTHLP